MLAIDTLLYTRSIKSMYFTLLISFWVFNLGSHIAFNHPISLVSFCLSKLLSLFLHFTTRTLLKNTDQVFFRMSLNLGFFLWYFSWLHWNYNIVGKYQWGDTPFSWHYIWGYMILICVITGAVHFDHLIMIMSTKLLQWKFNYFPLSVPYLLEPSCYI